MALNFISMGIPLYFLKLHYYFLLFLALSFFLGILYVLTVAWSSSDRDMLHTFHDVCDSMFFNALLSESCHTRRAVREMRRRVKESKELFFAENKKKKELKFLRKKYNVFIFENGEGWIKWKGGKGKGSVKEDSEILMSLRGA